MAAFLQKIPDDRFNSESDFVVKESKTMNAIVGIFFLIFSFAGFSVSLVFGSITLFIAIGAFVRSTKDETIIKINKKGFYYYGELVTDWDHFISDEFIDEVPLPSGSNPGVNDQFFVMIKYYKDGLPGYYGRKIRFTDSQDKSEDEIMAAIKFYYTNRQKLTQ
jgi:energy-coupling factor transporter transmembrane protein EcfT